EIREPLDDNLLARHAKSFGERSGNTSGIGPKRTFDNRPTMSASDSYTHSVRRILDLASGQAGRGVAHHELRSSRSFKNTVRWSGFSGNSGKASRNFAMTIGLVRRKNVLISPSTSSVDMYALLGS